MKRTAAVTGLTPQFVRWAIKQPCPFRELDVNRLPVTTFNQLRSLRSLSEGAEEGRIDSGVCWHAEADFQTPIGFPVDEVFDVFGSRQVIESECCNCAANAGTPSGWAGCHGWFAAATEWNPVALNSKYSGEYERHFNECRFEPEALVRQIEEVSSVIPDHELPNSVETSPRWYGLWTEKIIRAESLRPLELLFEKVAGRFGENANQSRFRIALQNCRKHGLELHVELVPNGFSNGSSWRIASHCAFCKAVRAAGRSHCRVCRTTNGVVQTRKAGVLGMRPYLNLDTIVGSKKARELFESYASRRKNGESD
ncbi:MAG: hypothetical protein AAF456_11160 [Planctomycetota bacterium]